MKRTPPQVRYRRTPHLLCHWRGEFFCLENYATGARVAADPVACRILHLLPEWRSVQEMARLLPEFSPQSIQRELQKLARETLVQRSDRAADARETAMEAWKYWNPEAGYFHARTRDVEYSRDRAAAERALRTRSRTDPKPSPVKLYAKAPSIELNTSSADSEFPRVLLARRTWRKFSRKPVELAAIGTLLKFTLGVQRWVTTGVGKLPLTISPSGGSLHPLEGYLVALNVKGLARGIYHYAADAHRLERLPRRATRNDIVKWLAGQTWFRGAAAVLFFSAVLARTQWRYPSGRAYRVVLAEAGHACQTFCLAATWLGLAPFCTMAFKDSLVEKNLGLDGIREPVLYAAGVGTRPAGLDWAP